MSSRRTTIWIGILLTVVLVALFSAVASANPLLSGYGGPGQGDQAILGATLLNGPGAGGSSGSSGSGEAETETASALTATEPRPASPSKGSRETAKGHRKHVRSHPSAPRKKAGTSKILPAGTSQTAFRLAPTSSGPTLGLSGADFLYILLTLAVLAFTGGITRQLARRPQ